MMEMPAWFVELRLEADHAWALELNEMHPDERRFWLQVDRVARRRMRDRLLYGVSFAKVSR